MSTRETLLDVKVPTELGVALCLLMLGAGCTALPPEDATGSPNDSNEVAGQVDVYVVGGTDELDGAQSYESSPVSDVDVVDGSVNAAIAQVGNESTAESVILSSATRELTSEEVAAAREALNESAGQSRPDSEYPGGVYFEYGDNYVVVSLAIYD